MITKTIYARLGALLVATVAITALAGGSAHATPMAGTVGSATSSCGSPIFAYASPPKDSVSPVPIVGHGWRSYSVGIGSYLQRCGGYVYARHLIYIDTRNLPYGHKLWITVSTQRSDGKWARAHHAPILEVTGHQKIEEVILHQRRGVGGGLEVTRVHVRHSAPPAQSAAYPFTRLRSDGIWTLDHKVPMDNVRPLKTHHVVGRLDPSLEDALRDPTIASAAARQLVESEFPPTIAPDVLMAVGLDPDAILSRPDKAATLRQRQSSWPAAILTAWDRQCAFCGFDGHSAQPPSTLKPLTCASSPSAAQTTRTTAWPYAPCTTSCSTAAPWGSARTSGSVCPPASPAAPPPGNLSTTSTTALSDRAPAPLCLRVRTLNGTTGKSSKAQR